MNEYIFGDAVPEIWGDWSPEAQRFWSSAVQMYREIRKPGTKAPKKKRESNTPTLRISWMAVESVGRESRLIHGGDEWWSLPWVRWSDIAEILRCGERHAAYRLRSIGWGFDGINMSRRVVHAPCLMCGSSWPAEDVRDGRGPCCEESP